MDLIIDSMSYNRFDENNLELCEMLEDDMRNIISNPSSSAGSPYFFNQGNSLNSSLFDEFMILPTTTKIETCRPYYSSQTSNAGSENQRQPQKQQQQQQQQQHDSSSSTSPNSFYSLSPSSSPSSTSTNPASTQNSTSYTTFSIGFSSRSSSSANNVANNSSPDQTWVIKSFF